jgi:hypothetical protein
MNTFNNQANNFEGDFNNMSYN